MPASYLNLLYIRDSVRDCCGAMMRYDGACLQILSDEKISFWSQYDECEGCILLETYKSPESDGYVLSTQSPVHYAVRNEIGVICNGTYHFGEFGQYIISLTQGLKGCHPRIMVKPDAVALQILRATLVFLALATLLHVVKGMGKRVVVGLLYTTYFAKSQSIFEKRVSTPGPSLSWSSTRKRIRSLDILRGIAIAIFVNAGGGGYQVFSHSVWNGITVADMVLPWFAFAMGEALVLSLNAKLRNDKPRMTAFYQVAFRALILSLFGIILVNTIWESIRLPGVLQRLAAMYLIVGALECAFMRDYLDIKPGTSFFRDISAGWKQWLATLFLVALQVCVTLLVPAPGCPRGYMGPGGLHLSAYGKNLTNCTGGIAGHIDRVLFGPYMYSGGQYKDIYQSINHDPKGLLGIFSGILLVQSGAHAARVLLVFNGARDRIARWVFWSMVFGTLGGALCMFSKNGGLVPLNTNLWSVSYCLVCASTALFAQAVLYFMVDFKNKWRCQPLYYAGQNTLFLYLNSELLNPWNWIGIGPGPFTTHSQLLVRNGVTMLFWLAVGFVMYKKRIFFHF